MRCKVGDLAIVVGGPAARDVNHVRGLICEVVGPSTLIEHDWSVRLSHKDSGWIDGTFSARDSWLRPLPPGDMSDETPAEVIKKLTEPA